MSITAMKYVWDNSPQKGSLKLMLLAIADNANENGDAFPGITRLAKKCSISERAAQQAINALERAGELQVFVQVGTKTTSGWTNLYRVVMKDAAQPAVYNQQGERVHPRPIKSIKERQFPAQQEVKPASPLQEVKPASPDGVQLASPHEVKPASPKPSVQPSVQPKEKIARRAIPATRINPMKDAIATAFGWDWSKMSRNEIGMVQSTAKQLCEIDWLPEDVPLLYAECKRRGWVNFKPTALPNVVSDVRNRVKTQAVILQLDPVTDTTDSGDFRVYDANGAYIGKGAAGLARKAELEAQRAQGESA